MRHLKLAAALSALALASPFAAAVAQDATAKPYQAEWVYKIKYGYQAEWWRIFQKYQIAVLDREQQLGYVKSYVVQRPGLHTSEDARWDYRIIITYPNWAGSTHEGEVDRALFPDREAEAKEDQRRWELTLNHWDLPIHEIDPHQAPQ
jgi:opacity protein-like surface antigen